MFRNEGKKAYDKFPREPDDLEPQENTMLGYFVIFGLLVGAFCWIIHPLLQEAGGQNGFTPKSEDILETLSKKKESAYAVIRELEFDLSMGKLTEEDFQILKRQYLQEAAGYMKELDQFESQKAGDSRSADANPEKEIEPDADGAGKPASSERKFIYCTACGRKVAAADRFCFACGSNLHEKRGEK